ncbi:YciI family protein [Streptomyces sp. NPDC047097]|uniref:YciI family protein n=1 Tax=Streptomyces sp. NPDC047097 TaxID=3155260 RepID=UPI0033C7247F
MQYMIQLNVPATQWESMMSSYSEDDMKAMFAHMGALNDDLSSAGELVEARGLGGPALTKTVRAGDDGRPLVSDGPDKQDRILAGYWVVDVKSEDRALQIAARASACPGPGGMPTNEPVEVHAVPDGPPEA